MGVCCMQLSILSNGVCMLDLRKLFFSQESDLKNRIRYKGQCASFKKLAIFALSRLLVLFFLGLPAQVLSAEGVINQTTNEGASSQKAAIDSPAASNENASVANAVTSIITSKHHPYLLRSDFQNRAEDLETLYKMAGNNLLWLGNAQAKKNILDVLNLLENASVNGLNSTSYDTQSLQQRLPSALTIAPDNYKQLALYDTAISLSLLRFLHDLHYGRVNPKEINFNLKLREKKQIDLPALIKTSLAQGTIGQLPELVEPKLKQYQKLKQALATYRLLAKNPVPFQLFITKSINPGSNFPQAKELGEFLAKLGDLPEEQSSDSNTKNPNRYSGKLVAGVKNFQLRHGMNADGVLGKGTVAAINEPLRLRVTQIELAMERLRWLPEASAGASIIVNIPAFQLWAFDDVDEFNANMPNMRVVVGKALKNQTPVLMAEMSFIDFMPYWNVPYNIVKEEILPKLMQNPGYLAGQDMELVATFGNETKAVGFTAFIDCSAQARYVKNQAASRQKECTRQGKVYFSQQE